MRLLRVMAAFAETPWAMDLGRLQALASLLERASLDQEIEVDALAGPEAKSERQAAAAQGAKQNVAVIPVYGVVAHRAYMVQGMCGSGGASAEILDAQVRAALDDPSVRSIVLDIDSPGGSVYGIAELGATIFEGRQKKPIAAVANSTASSAAYWLASAAHEIYVIPSGEVGSIGVFAKHVDTTKADEAQGKVTTIISAGKYKTEGAGPLTDDAREFMQSRIDGYYTDFVKAVAKHRGVAVEAVRNGYGQGRALSAKPALEAGMVDGIATLSEVISKYARRTAETANRSRADAERLIAVAAAGADPTIRV